MGGNARYAFDRVLLILESPHEKYQTQVIKNIGRLNFSGRLLSGLGVRRFSKVSNDQLR